MAKKLVLDIAMETDFEMIGIVSPIKDYRLMFYLNKAMKCKFKRQQPFLFEKKDEDVNFGMYHYNDCEHRTSLYLINNHSVGHSLIPEYKQIDYVLVMDGDIDETYIKEIQKMIKQVAHVRMSMRLQPDRIKNYDEIAMQFELCFSNQVY